MVLGGRTLAAVRVPARRGERQKRLALVRTEMLAHGAAGAQARARPQSRSRSSRFVFTTARNTAVAVFLFFNVFVIIY